MIKYENKFVEIFPTGEVEEFFCTALPFNYTEKSVCISRKDGYQKKGYIYTLVTFDMENDFPISLTYNSITDDAENWKNPISQSTEVKNCKPQKRIVYLMFFIVLLFHIVVIPVWMWKLGL